MKKAPFKIKQALFIDISFKSVQLSIAKLFNRPFLKLFNQSLVERQTCLAQLHLHPKKKTSTAPKQPEEASSFHR